MEILKQIDEIINTRNEKMTGLKQTIENYENEIKEKRKKALELKDKFSKTLDDSLPEEIAENESDIIKITSKINTIMTSMEYQPKVEITPEEIREEFKEKVIESGVKESIDMILQAQQDYFNSLKIAAEKIKPIANIRRDFQEKEMYFNEEVFYDLTESLASAFREVVTNRNFDGISSDYKGYHEKTLIEQNLLNEVMGYIKLF